MFDLLAVQNQIRCVTNFHDLVSTPFIGNINALCWQRELPGDFSEIVNAIELTENLVVIEPKALQELRLSQHGQMAREVILNDLELLNVYGASPVLNLIRNYQRDETNAFFPTDVYSFHADRAPIPTSTFLCTYYGESSQILPNDGAIKKVRIPHIRSELKRRYNGPEEDFEAFLSEHFYDLHYEALPGASPVSMGPGHLWRLAVDHPESKVLPCVHRAPIEKPGQPRLLLIC